MSGCERLVLAAPIERAIALGLLPAAPGALKKYAAAHGMAVTFGSAATVSGEEVIP